MNRRAVVAAVWALAAAGTAAGQDLAADVERLLAKHRLGAAAVGVCAIRVKTGEILFAQREAETFPLASVTKVFTAAAALEVLGEGHEFPTRVWIERGAPGEAALVMVGGGDPGLSGRDHDGNPTAVFERWAADLKAAGIRKITGIALDETRFGADHVSDQWPKDQLHKWYAAPCGALSLNDGCVDITVSAGKAGEPAGVSLSPATEFVTIINKCVTTTDRKAHMISIWRQPGKNTIVIDGKFWTGGSRLVESVTIDDPALYCATVFRETLARKGLETAGAGFHRLASPYPPPFEAGEPLITATGMKEALRVMLRRSQNFYAEQLLRAAGPAGGTFAEAAAAGKAALAPLGVADADFTWVDGSGLARGNRAAPATVARFFAAAGGRPWAPLFLDALAAPGASGTLERRLPGLEESVRAKTGTISGVSNLAGVVEAPGGRIAFAILISQLREGSSGAQGFQDDFVRLLSRK